MSGVKYSVIIPHKNIPELLARCIDSVPKRGDVEIIVVDDDSDPEMVDFSTFPGLEDSRVEVVFTKEGKGAGYARNVGIEHARGEWLLFADADDYYITENLNRLFDYSIPEDCNVIMWRFVMIDYEGNQSIGDQKQLEDDYCLVRCEDEMYPYMFCQPVNKMVKTSFIRQNRISFEEVPVANDTMFSARISVSIDHYYFYNADCYYYIKREHSLMTTNSVENLKLRHEVNIRVNEFLSNKGKKVRFDGGYGNWLAQVNYPIFFSVFCKDVITNGFSNAYRRYSICCRNYSKLSRIPFYTYLKRKIKIVLKRSEPFQTTAI